MPINYSNSGFVDPNVQIKSTEIPLSGIEKGVEKLTKYYDAARDNETKTQAYLRKLKSSVHPVDQELAESLGTSFNNRIKERVAKGNYEDMVWQTQGDAQDVAVMYDKLAKDSESIRKHEDFIRTDKAILTQEDRDTEAAIYLDNIKKTRPEYLPQGRMLTPGSIAAPSYTPDVHGVDFIGKIANGWQFDSESFGRLTTRVSDGSIQNSDGSYIPKGQSYTVNEQGKVSYISEAEMRDSLNKSIKKDPAVMSSLRQSVNRSLYRQPLREGETEEMRAKEVYDRLFGSQVDFVSQRDSFTREESKTSEIVKDGKKGSNSSGGDGTSNNNFYSGEGKYQLTSSTRPDKSQERMMKLSGELPNNPVGSMLTVSGDQASLGDGLRASHPAVSWLAPSGKPTTNEEVLDEKASQFNWMSKIAHSKETADSPYLSVQEGDANFFSVMNKLGKNPETPLTDDEKSVLGKINQIRNSTGKSTVSRVYHGLSSPQFNDYLSKVMPEEMKDKTFGATNALDKLTTYFFGKDGEIGGGMGIAGDFEVYDYQTGKKVNAASPYFKEIVENAKKSEDLPTVNSNDKGDKSLKVQIKGIINPTNPAGITLPTRTDKGTSEFMTNGLVVNVGGKDYLFRNPKEKVNTLDLAVGYSKLLTDEDAPAKTALRTASGQEIPIEIKAFGNNKYTINSGGKKSKIVNNIPIFTLRNSEGQPIDAAETEEELLKEHPEISQGGYRITNDNPMVGFLTNLLKGN